MLGIFGLADADCVSIDGFVLGASSIFIGEDLTFSFTVSANDTTKVRFMIDTFVMPDNSVIRDIT